MAFLETLIYGFPADAVLPILSKSDIILNKKRPAQ